MNCVSLVFSEFEQWKDTLERIQILQEQDVESGTEEPYYVHIIRHVNATKSYLHFDRFAGEAILCSNFFCFLLFLDVLFLS